MCKCSIELIDNKEQKLLGLWVTNIISMLIARFMIGKGLVVQGRPLNETVMRSPKISRKPVLFYSNKFQHRFEMSQQILWPARKRHLTPMMEKKRLDIVRRHRHWTLAEWKKMVFSDECSSLYLATRTLGGHLVRNVL